MFAYALFARVSPSVEFSAPQVFATGYRFSFPFLASDVIPVSQNQAALYKNVFPPELDQPTVAVIGLVQPLGSTLPISEMQARWAANVFKGNGGCFLGKEKTRPDQCTRNVLIFSDLP